MTELDLKHIDNSTIYHSLGLSKEQLPQFKNTTKLVYENNVPIIKFTPFMNLDFIEHGFSTRLGGVSSGIYRSMNLTFNRGDDPECVHENFRRIASALSITPDQMICSQQTHTTNVLRVGIANTGMGITKPRDFHDIDGLITNDEEVCLVTSYADCVPLFFVDPVHKAIGSSHAGWRGTVGNIAHETIQKMQVAYGTNPKDLLTFIGPSICVDCYEVSEDVAIQFKNAFSSEQASFIIKAGNVPGKYQLNLQMANYFNMVNAGILSHNISISDICTCCNPEILYSHRASLGKRGVLCGFIYLRRK
jgi:YfiH family protein